MHFNCWYLPSKSICTALKAVTMISMTASILDSNVAIIAFSVAEHVTDDPMISLASEAIFVLDGSDSE